MSAFKSGHGTGTMSRNETSGGGTAPLSTSLTLLLEAPANDFSASVTLGLRVCLLMLFVLFYPRFPYTGPQYLPPPAARGEIEPSALTNRRHGSVPWPDLR
jgi:hypothetical protein